MLKYTKWPAKMNKMAACIQKSRVGSTRVKSSVKAKFESKVEVLKISLKVWKKTKTSAIRIIIVLCIFSIVAHKK